MKDCSAFEQVISRTNIAVQEQGRSKEVLEEMYRPSIRHRRPLEVIHNADQAEMQTICGRKLLLGTFQGVGFEHHSFQCAVSTQPPISERKCEVRGYSEEEEIDFWWQNMPCYAPGILPRCVGS